MTDYTFASALLSTKSASLLNKAQFRELRNADDDGFILKLQSFGYGVGEQPKAVEAIVGAEVLKLKRELSEIMPNDDLAPYFFTKYDLTNIRAYYKKKLFQAELGPFEPAGFLTEKELSQAILKNDYYNLQEPYKHLIFEANNQTFSDSHSLVTFLEKTFQKLMYEQIKSRQDASLEKYFVISTDINNLITLLRSRKLKSDAEQVKNNLLDCGSISIADIVHLVEASDREVTSFYATAYLTRFSEPLDLFFEDGNFSSLEHALLRFLVDELTSDTVDIKSSANIIIYVIRKQIELIDIRRIHLDRASAAMVDET